MQINVKWRKTPVNGGKRLKVEKWKDDLKKLRVKPGDNVVSADRINGILDLIEEIRIYLSEHHAGHEEAELEKIREDAP